MRPNGYIQVALPLKLDWIPYYRVPDGCGEVVVGDKVRVRFARRDYVGVVVNVADTLPESLPASKVQPIDGVETGLARIDRREIELWQEIAQYYMCTVGEVFKTACPAAKFNREEMEARKRERLEKRRAKLEDKIARARTDTTREKYRKELESLTSGDSGSDIRTGSIELSPAQQAAYESIKAAFGRGKTALLEGVTGSGKTEIYSRLAGEALRSGRNVLYLVPEIALSRQLEDRLAEFFGDSLLIFHSHESVASRGQVASAVAGQTGQPYIVLGTRSALFLPHHDLGLVIVDEEHDSSYKQDSPAPRYNGRDVAIMLAKKQGADILLGSATPSLESEYNCSAGRFERVLLEEKYHGGTPAEVEIIDTKAERRKRGMHGSFSRKLIAHIGETLEEGGQVLILRGRRSYSPAVQCTACGDIPKCPRCNVSLSLHKKAVDPKDEQAGGRLVCHHCGYSIRYDGACHVCGGVMEGLGAGTQKIEEEAEALFPQARIARLDSDVARSAREEAAIIKSFAEGTTDILIGTQMVSKGFDFENLRLVAVMQADTMLAVQDFRADERAAQLMEQVRGRCCRRGGSGLFVIQTSLPDHPVYSRLEDGTQFRSSLLDERREFGYPPYYRMIVVNYRDKFADRAERMATALSNCLLMALGKRTEDKKAIVTGPFAPVRETEDGEHVRSIRISLARTKDLAKVKDSLYRTVVRFEIENRCEGHITIDVDPL